MSAFLPSQAKITKLHCIRNSVYRISLILTASVGVGVATCKPSEAATMYSILDLGNLGSSQNVQATGINNLGQVVGTASTTVTAFNTPVGNVFFVHAYRTQPNSAINPATDDLGTLMGVNQNSIANDINISYSIRAVY